MNHRLSPIYDAAMVARLLDISYTAEELASFGPPPQSLDSFVTFFDPGWSILRLRDAAADKGNVFERQSWYNAELFAQANDAPRYRQVRTDAGPGSHSKLYSEQVILLPADEEVPTARVVITAVVVHFLATGERLMRDLWVRCRDLDMTVDGNHVTVSGFHEDGINVNGSGDHYRDSTLTLSSSRK